MRSTDSNGVGEHACAAQPAALSAFARIVLVAVVVTVLFSPLVAIERLGTLWTTRPQ